MQPFQRPTPIQCFYCGKPNHKAADCFYKFRDDTREMKEMKRQRLGQGEMLETFKTSGSLDTENSFARNGNFTKPIAPLHTSKFYIPRRYVKPIGVGFHGVTRFPSTHTTHTGNMGNHISGGSIQNDFPPQQNVQHSQQQNVQQSVQHVQQNVQEGLYYNERQERRSEGSFEDSQLQHDDPFITALEFMISERKRLGPDNFPSVKCENEIWKNLHLTLVECEKNFK